MGSQWSQQSISKQKNLKSHLYPTAASTCVNIIIVPAMTFVLNDEDQYKMYDMAFMNIYFGLGNHYSKCLYYCITIFES